MTKKGGCLEYYICQSGAMKTDWLSDGVAWYYLGTDGAMRTGWWSVGGKFYYGYDSGKMAFNTKIGVIGSMSTENG